MDKDLEQEDPMLGSSPIVIKLKIPKKQLPKEETLQDVASKDINIRVRVCSVCKKEFSSGKALGGHMRVHVAYHKITNTIFKPPSSKSKKNDLSNNGDEGLMKKMMKPYYLSSVNDEGVPTCSQCGKTFPSMKSLFGHMRCHPDRVWRGILPPRNADSPRCKSNSLSSSTNIVGDDGGEGEGEGGDVVDLAMFLEGWSVTDRRGRKLLKISDDDADEEVLLEAVEDLMSLANGFRSSVIEGSNSNANSPPSIDKGKGVMVNEIEAKMKLDEYNSDSGNTNEELVVSYKCNKINKKRKKMKLMVELELESDLGSGSEQQQPVVDVPECKYKCTTCNKCFKSHQALGGHRASHNETAKMTEDDLDSENVVKEAEFGADFNSNGNGTHSHVHQCTIRDKVFPTGQTLGGHKRCHSTGHTEAQAQAQAISSQITSTGEAASHETGSDPKVVFPFDLNEMAPVMMEDEGGNVNGYATSSYNSKMVDE